MNRLFPKFLIFFSLVIPAYGQNNNMAIITVRDTVYHTIGPQFYGIQYHGHTFSDQTALDLLNHLNLKIVRVWAEIQDFHPRPGVWHWKELDQKIAEIIAAGYEAVPCLWGEKWFVGSADTAWWNYDAALAEWDSAAYRLADRYKNTVRKIIVFDELNMLHPEQDYYISFKDAARLFLRAAKSIKSVNPNIRCGGPSSFGGWENGQWANYVLNEPNGSDYLDFISSNTFLSWNPSDSDQEILARTIWYEEVPLKIKEMLNDKLHPELMLDAYNLSALWTWNGELWTDPRNTNSIGGIYQVAALLHGAKGGFDITIHWEILGGFGIFNWYPQFNEMAPYYSWKLLVEIAGLTNDSQIIGCTTTEVPKSDVQHHGGMNVDLYDVQPFAIRRVDGGISVVLINKNPSDTLTRVIHVPPEMKSYELYRYDDSRMQDSSLPLEQKNTEPVLEINCPPYSVTVIKFGFNEQTRILDNSASLPKTNRLYQNYPNPFNAQTTIVFDLLAASHVSINILNILGENVKSLVNDYMSAGRHSIVFDASSLSSGIYYYQMKTDNYNDVKQFILSK